jgi:hypothetical protein
MLLKQNIYMFIASRQKLGDIPEQHYISISGI